MFDSIFGKVRQPGKIRNWNPKKIMVLIIFGAIILVFALFGITNPDRYGMGTGGGTAAVVNDTNITLAEFKQRADMMARNSRLPLDKLPSEQREMYTKEIQRRTIEQMIVSEIIFQSAFKQGVWASNIQVADELRNIPVFQENGRFMRSRYDGFLAQMGESSDDFEREIRKEIVIRRVQGLFETAVAPSSMELDQLSELNSHKADIRFVELTQARLQSDKLVTDAEAGSFAKDPAHAEELKKYYDQHALDYQRPERVHARHILLLVDEKHTDKEVAEKIKSIRAGLTASNFAKTAEKESQDPGSGKKGGDLGFFEKGRMVPEFETIAFKLKPGEISEPFKTQFGYHIVMLEEHQPARTVGLDEAKIEIARKLVAQIKAPQEIAAIKKTVESGRVTEVETALKNAGLTWQKADGVNLGTNQVSGVRDPQTILAALAKRVSKGGLVNELVGTHDPQYIVDVVKWEKNDKPPARDELARNLAYQESSDSFDAWIKDAETKSSVTRNPKLFDR